MDRIQEMRYHSAMKAAEHTEELLHPAMLTEAERARIRAAIADNDRARTRLWHTEQELLDIVDGLTANLAYGRMDESEFYRVRALRDRIANVLRGLCPKETR